MTEVGIACDECLFADSAGREREYICRSRRYPNGKNIYSETYGVLKKVGCATGMRK